MKNILIAIVSVLGFVAFVGWCASGPSADLLNASAGRGATTIQITNHESAPLRDCRLQVSDSAGTIWVAAIESDLPPSATATVTWSDFTSDGQPMPGYIGRDRGVTMSCDVGPGGPRKSVGFGH